MDIRAYAKKLRHAADVLEDLIVVPCTENIAAQIRKGYQSGKKPLFRGVRSYDGKHWTQRPENAAKKAKMIKRSVAAKKAKRAA